MSENTLQVTRMSFESIIVYRSTLRTGSLSERAYNIRVREFGAVTFVRAKVHVGVIPTYRVGNRVY